MGLVYGCFAQNKTHVFLEKELQKTDSISSKKQLLQLLQEVEKRPTLPFAQSRQTIYYIQLAALYAKELDGFNDKSTAFYQKALQLAEQSGDLGFQTWVYSKVGFYYYAYNRYTNAFTYFTKSSYALNQRTDDEVFRVCEVLKLNGYFFQTITEYDTSTAFLLRALKLVPPNSTDHAAMLNALGENYLNEKEIETAETYFVQTKKSAIAIQDTIRYAKALGDLARVEITRGNWDQAEKLLLEDIEISRKLNEWRNMMFAQLQLGKMFLTQRKLAEANQTLLAVRSYANSKSYLKAYEKESTELLLQIAIAQQHTMQELQLRRALDSLVLQIKDMDKTTIDVVALNYQKKNIEWELDVQQIQLEKAQVLQKTWLIISLLLLIIVALIYILYRRRMKLNTIAFQNKLLVFQHDKMKMEATLAETHNSLDSFHTYIDSKNEQINKLEQELKHIKNRDQKRDLKDLLTSHLMTDNNWNLFKRAFREEQMAYYDWLLTRFPDLTESNLRIVLLQKMGLNNLEVAQIIGITPDAVKKAKQRLRKKYSEKEEELLDFDYFLTKD